MQEKTVFVPNKGAHDFSLALQYGDLHFLTEGRINPTAVGGLYRQLEQEMQNASSHDYLLIHSLPILNVLAATILVDRFRRLNLLIWRKDHYAERNLYLGDGARLTIIEDYEG